MSKKYQDLRVLQQQAQQAEAAKRKASSGRSPKQPPQQSDEDGPPSTNPGDTYYLPEKTLELLKTKNQTWIDQQKIENFALLLNKCALQERKPKKSEQEQKERFIVFRKKDEKKNIAEYRVKPNFHQVPLAAICQRHADAIHALNLEVAEIPNLKIDWRLIIGLGNESVYETSMTLHHIYGIPYIPGQAVKGVLRSWLIVEKFGTKKDETGKEEKLDLEGAEKRALKDTGFCDIFGCPAESVYGEARQGKVYFFDAFPTNLTDKSIQPDIMNPHYPDYYQGNKPPADYQDPRPIPFLTVVNTTFEFFVGVASENNQEIVDAASPFYKKTLLGVVQEQLPLAFSLHGIGAKTAVGYGYFSGV